MEGDSEGKLAGEPKEEDELEEGEEKRELDSEERDRAIVVTGEGCAASSVGAL